MNLLIAGDAGILEEVSRKLGPLGVTVLAGYDLTSSLEVIKRPGVTIDVAIIAGRFSSDEQVLEVARSLAESQNGCLVFADTGSETMDVRLVHDNLCRGRLGQLSTVEFIKINFPPPPKPAP